jgi:hypothetical protein
MIRATCMSPTHSAEPAATTPGRSARRAARPAGVLLAVVWVLLTIGCGGAHGTTADLPPLPQPTPDPTLDAVVRGLPRSAPVASSPGSAASSVSIGARSALPTPTPAPSRQLSVAGAEVRAATSAQTQAQVAPASQVATRAGMLSAPGPANKPTATPVKTR